MAQYLTEKELDLNIDLSSVEVFVTDTYNEAAIYETIIKNDIQELFACAISFSIIGFGGKNYGSVKINGNLVDIRMLLKKNNVNITAKFNDRIDSDTLTPRRLCRFFRFKIQKYIEQFKISSYLKKKYSSNIDIPSQFCFPGIEYSIPKEYSEQLIQVYTNLDLLKETTLTDRIKKVLIARGINK